MDDMALSHVPVLESLHIYLNGVEQHADTDWQLLTAPPRLKLLAAMDVRAGDLLEARYAYEDPTAYAAAHSLSSSPFRTPGAPGAPIAAPTQAGGCTNPMAGWTWGTPPPNWTPQFTGAIGAGPGAGFDVGWTHTGAPTEMPGTFMQAWDTLDSTGCLTSATGVSSGAEVNFYTEHYVVPAGHHFAGIAWGHSAGGVITVWAMAGLT